MASSVQCSVWVPSLPNLNTNTLRSFSLHPNSVSFSSPFTRIRASSSSPTLEEATMSIDNLRRFINLNSGKWNGSFYVPSQPLLKIICLPFCFHGQILVLLISLFIVQCTLSYNSKHSYKDV